MLLFGYPIQIWIACIVAILVKLQSTRSLTVFGVITTVAVAMGSGVLLYGPMLALLSLEATWSIPMAIILALSAENILKAMLDISDDRKWIKDQLRSWLLKDVEK